MLQDWDAAAGEGFQEVTEDEADNPRTQLTGMDGVRDNEEYLLGPEWFWYQSVATAKARGLVFKQPFFFAERIFLPVSPFSGSARDLPWAPSSNSST